METLLSWETSLGIIKKWSFNEETQESFENEPHFHQWKTKIADRVTWKHEIYQATSLTDTKSIRQFPFADMRSISQTSLLAQGLSGNLLCWHKICKATALSDTWSIRQLPFLNQTAEKKAEEAVSYGWSFYQLSNPLHQSVKKHLLCICPIIHLQKAWKNSFPKFSEVLFIEPIYEKTMFWYVVN